MSQVMRTSATGISTRTPPLAMVLGLAAVALLGPMDGLASAQFLEREIRGAPDGRVVFEYAIDGEVEMCRHGGMRWGGSWTRSRRDRADCTVGVAQVELRVVDGAVTEIEIGPPSRASSGDTNLGERNPQEVADYFLGLARLSSRRDVAEEAILPAVIAEGVTVWPQLDAIARDTGLDHDVRESAVFWLSQIDGGGEYLQDLYEGVESRSLKERIIFALSQNSPEWEAVEQLMDIALDDEDADLQKSALFWLGQSEDLRVADFLLDLIRPRVAR